MTNTYINESLVIGESRRHVSDHFRQAMVMDMSMIKLDHYVVALKTMLRGNLFEGNISASLDRISVEMNSIPTVRCSFMKVAGPIHKADFTQPLDTVTVLITRSFCLKISGEQYCQPIMLSVILHVT
eukprot:GHVS01007284.1.p2 GENE.GHVS01007284.1~~GHVS01007284.1.p2  ORF type:complete len:127 (+),score=5.02 GHVS01007284.1:439-819(+)